jgi:hypothetical protein
MLFNRKDTKMSRERNVRTMDDLVAMRNQLFHTLDLIEDQMIGEMLLVEVLNGNEKPQEIEKTKDVIKEYQKRKGTETK